MKVQFFFDLYRETPHLAPSVLMPSHRFKESGKWIVSYSEIYSQKAYYLASVSDELWLNPQGMVEWKGLGSQMMFLKGMFEKLEVEPHKMININR